MAGTVRFPHLLVLPNQGLSFREANRQRKMKGRPPLSLRSYRWAIAHKQPVTIWTPLKQKSRKQRRRGHSRKRRHGHRRRGSR